MKRYVIPGILAALLTVSLLPAPTYTYVVRELSQTFTAIQSFGAGATIPAGQKIYIGATGTNSYLIGDDDTKYVSVYINGTLKATVTPNGVIPGACNSNLWAMETGTNCVDSSNRTIAVTSTGPVVVAGSAP